MSNVVIDKGEYESSVYWNDDKIMTITMLRCRDEDYKLAYANGPFTVTYRVETFERYTFYVTDFNGFLDKVVHSIDRFESERNSLRHLLRNGG